MEISNKKVFITGGSAGIGKALVEKLIKKGVKDFAVMGRTMKKLNDLENDFSSARFIKIQGDVSKPDNIRDAASTVKEQWGELDILINNAGAVSAGLLVDISDEDVIGQINVNLTGLILVTKHLLPLLKESEEGAIINVSSGLGYIGMPFYSVYAASKSAVNRFSEALRRELKDFSIHVMSVSPTSTDTDMMKSANVNGEMDRPGNVAEAAVEGLLSKHIEVILGGEDQKKMIETNKNEPLKVDKKVEQQFEAMRKRTEHHRSM